MRPPVLALGSRRHPAGLCGCARMLVACLLTTQAVLALQGCATSYTLPNGDQRIIGLVALTLPAASASKAAEQLRVQNVGAMFYSHADQTGLSIGYSNLAILQLENNACVIRRAAFSNDPRHRE